MSELIAEPQRVVDMHTRLLEVRDRIVPSWARHVDAMESLYGELVAERRSAQRSSVR
jgi:hypothetical protein